VAFLALVISTVAFHVFITVPFITFPSYLQFLSRVSQSCSFVDEKLSLSRMLSLMALTNAILKLNEVNPVI